MSTANHPQTDGLTERVNRVVEDCLRSFVNHHQSHWDSLLPLCQFAINNSYQSSTGESPFFLNSGQHPLTPSSLVDSSVGRNYTDREERPRHWLEEKNEALRIARDSPKAAQTRQAFYSDCGRKEVKFRLGIKFWFIGNKFLITPEARYRPCDKLRPRWYGPFKVIKIITKKCPPVGVTSFSEESFRL